MADHGGKNWKAIAERFDGERSDVQCLHRWQKVLNPDLVKGPWTLAVCSACSRSSLQPPCQSDIRREAPCCFKHQGTDLKQALCPCTWTSPSKHIAGDPAHMPRALW